MNAVACCTTAAFALALLLSAAQADVTISTATTQNMTCSGGVCTPTATDAVLNVSDLENLLASGNVEVTTTGSGVQANNIDVSVPFGWSSGNNLTFDAYQSITIDKTIAVTGSGGAALMASMLSFGQKGHLQFANTTSSLTINGAAYTLVNSLSSLASAIAANPAGTFALANNYNASGDGTYSTSPIQTTFTGTLDGLGNAISHVTIDATGFVGLFQSETGSVQNLQVLDAKIRAEQGAVAGVLTGFGGNLFRVRVSGSIYGHGDAFGGLVGSGGNVEYCSADVRINNSQPGGAAAGLIATSANIDASFSTGAVTAGGRSIAGGLVAFNDGRITNSYSTGAVIGGNRSKIGGFYGKDLSKGRPGSIATSYSTGAVSAGSGSDLGGFAGKVSQPKHGHIQNSYWDTTTSGTDQGTGEGNEPGITGLTTEQLQSGLPKGFDPSVWGEKKSINNGLPYLLANPPVE